ncbi:Sec1-binding region of Mso1 domain-containing protein [Trichoderma ceciliae]
MSSWYSNLVTKTSSQISNLRSTLLSSEADGDTEDDTHVCRVLRNYYTEKGRAFPNWLPPDPKAPPPQTTQAVYAQPQVGSRYGGLGGPQQAGAGGLSSLWDSGPAQQQQQQQPQIPQSLRTGRPATTQPGGSSREEVLRAQAPRSGSYSGPGGPAPAVGSAQDRLKQRLWGTRTTSPSSINGNGPFQPPPGGGATAAAGGGGHQSQGSYEDRFAPGGTYDNARGEGNGQPFVGSNAPWSSDGGPYSGGGATNGVRRKGLPSGPRGYR